MEVRALEDVRLFSVLGRSTLFDTESLESQYVYKLCVAFRSIGEEFVKRSRVPEKNPRMSCPTMLVTAQSRQQVPDTLYGRRLDSKGQRRR